VGSFSDVWISREGDVWAVGSGAMVVHFDGSTWRDLSGTGFGRCRAVCGVSADTVYVVIDDEVWRYHEPVGGEPAGELLFTSSSDYVYFDIHASGHDWVVAAGALGKVALFDGSAWTEETLGTEQLATVLTDYFMGSRVAVVCGYGGSIYLYEGAWTQYNVSTREDWSDIGGVAGTPDTMYGIRGGGLVAYGGSPPHWYTVSSIPSVALEELFCTGANEIWAIGSSTDPYAIDRFAYAYNGILWVSYWLSSDSDPRDIWCEDGDRVCIVGDNATVWYRVYEPTSGWYFSMTQAVTPPQDLHGVWGYTYSDIYAVGENGIIVHSTDGGEQWILMTSNTTAHLRDVWGWAADSLVAVGDGGTVMFYDGSVWAAMPSVAAGDLRSVWCGGYDDIWVADGGNVVIHWNGAAWERYDTALPMAPIRAVWGSDSDVWFACENDYVLIYLPPIW
jgi:hypothetical protein